MITIYTKNILIYSRNKWKFLPLQPSRNILTAIYLHLTAPAPFSLIYSI